MGETVMGLLSRFCKCSFCNEIMTNVAIVEQKRYCVDCVLSLLKEDPFSEKWAGAINSGVWTSICKIYQDHVNGVKTYDPFDRSATSDELQTAEKMIKIKEFIASSNKKKQEEMQYITSNGPF